MRIEILNSSKVLAVMCVLLAAYLATAGCSGNPAPDDAGAATSSSNPGSDTTASENPPNPNVSVSVVDAEGFTNLVAAHVGDVVLVDAWATW